MVAMATVLLAVTGFAASGDGSALLTDDQVAAVIKDSASLKMYIEDATADQVVDILIQIITHLDGEEMALGAKQAIVLNLFEVTRQVKGGAAPAFTCRVTSKRLRTIACFTLKAISSPSRCVMTCIRISTT